MNTFLSNFSEVNFPDMTSVSDLDDTELVRFAISHDALNSPKFWEEAVDSPENRVGLTPTNRESVERINELTSRYLGTTADMSSVAARSLFVPSSEYVYFNEADVVTSPQGIACVTDMRSRSDGSIEVSFAVVTGSYDPTDDSLYYCEFDELLNRLGAGMAAYQGVAVVKTGADSQYSNGLVLVSYSRDGSDADSHLSAKSLSTQSSMTSSFWGVWIGAEKDEDSAEAIAAEARGKGLSASVFHTIDWSNLNSEPWYVISVGTSSSESEANDLCDKAIAAGYSDAYVKSSGDPR